MELIGLSVCVSADPPPKNTHTKLQQQKTTQLCKTHQTKTKTTTPNDNKTHAKLFFYLFFFKGKEREAWPALSSFASLRSLHILLSNKITQRGQEREEKKDHSPSSFCRDEVLEIFTITAITILCAGNGRGASQRHRDNSAPGGPEGPDAGHRSPRQHLHPLPTVLRARLAHLPPAKAAGARGGGGGGGAGAEVCQGQMRLAILFFCLAFAFLLFPWLFLWLAVKLATIASGSCLRWSEVLWSVRVVLRLGPSGVLRSLRRSLQVESQGQLTIGRLEEWKCLTVFLEVM